VSRAGYYRFIQPVAEPAEEMELRYAIQKLAVEMPAYGYRRITMALRRGGWVVNHKRVLRLMGADNLLCLRRRAFVRTTDSDHQLRVYPNLARDLKVSGLNQLWVADITYIRLVWEFVYLAVILDAFSRRVIGWALGPHARGRVGTRSVADGDRSWPSRAGTGASFGSRSAICLGRLHRAAH
jgi:putative transposase